MHQTIATKTVTSVVYRHILKHDFIADENWYDEPLVFKAGKIVAQTLVSNKQQSYTAYVKDVKFDIPSDIVDIKKVTTTTTNTVVTEDFPVELT